MGTTSNEKKVALITGGSRGIGAALCIAFAKAGYRVALNYISNSVKAKEVEIQVKEKTDCLVIQTDVSRSDQVEAMISRIKQRFGRLDVLVNNAGVMANAVFSLIPEEEWDRVIAVHLKGTYLCSKFASTLMIEQRSGVIINMASISAFKPLVGQSNYAAAKAGIVTLTKSMAKELGRWNIRANCIAPGYIQSDLMDTFAENEEDKRMFKQIPLRRVGIPGDVADLALFLASDQSKYITGETIRIDGGLSI